MRFASVIEAMEATSAADHAHEAVVHVHEVQNAPDQAQVQAGLDARDSRRPLKRRSLIYIPAARRTPTGEE